jgi:phospholipid/cholesterol/gamma-HCH transport system ATP-binding protein
MNETTAKLIIRLKDVRKAFGPTEVLRGVNLEIYPESVTVIIGPSGCGKSVLLKHIVRLLRPDSGRVFFRDRDITDLSEKQLVDVRREMGFLFQGSALFDSMSVAQNICFPLEEYRVGDEAFRRDRCEQVLGLVGLKALSDRYPEELSGGQKKRIALARAIALNPSVILYDEPTTGLDPIRADLINELILRTKRTLRNTAVVVTHDMASARKIADRILMLHEGHFILDTGPDDLDDAASGIVARFIHGQASPEELEEIRGERFEPISPTSADAEVQG